MGEVIDFFLARHPVEADGSFPVMCALEQSMAPCQQTFARLTLMDVSQFRAGKVTCGKEQAKKAQRHLSLTVSSARTHKKRSNANVLHRA
jgi:hypothetical protein